LRAHHYAPYWIQLEPHAPDGSELILPVAEYGAAYTALRDAALGVIGVDMYTATEQANRCRLPDWRSYTRYKGTSWLCAEQADYWSKLAHGAIREGSGRLWDVASRISNQLRVCEWRLRQLSEAYYEQLIAIVRSARFRAGVGIHDGFTWLGYLSLHSFLVDACVLRDYLAEYRALILPPDLQPESRTRSFAALRDNYLAKATLTLGVDKAMRAASERGGWLHTLSNYRNLVVHYAPLASAKNDLYCYCEFQLLTSGVGLPAIKFPIPENPADIITRRRSGSYLEDPSQDYARFANVLRNVEATSDALDYALAALLRLGSLSEDLAALSQIAPRGRHFIVGEDGAMREE
jgi:hypothetical protein